MKPMPKVFPNVKTSIRSIAGGHDSHDFALPVDDCRRLIVQRGAAVGKATAESFRQHAFVHGDMRF